MPKKRLDDILVEKDLVTTKSKARAMIIDEKVIVNNEKVTKAGTQFDSEKIKISIINNDKKFVSRAGEKLFKAVKIWNLNLKNKVCLDIGSSTGGFTQVCLEEGAEKVFALDVGTNQLDWSLRSNEKVISMENKNFRYCVKDDFDDDIDFFCCDVSFISLSKIIPQLNLIVEENVEGVLLIKPQFELSPSEVTKGKIVTRELHLKAIKNVINYANENSFSVLNINFSPILGNKKHNIEYITLIKKTNTIKNNIDINIDLIVNEAWKFFEEKI